MGIRYVSPKRREDFSISASEGVILPGFFNERKLEIFFELIQHRRPLPVFHGDFWRCFDCCFEAEDFEEMAVHIMKCHGPASIHANDEIEQEFAFV